MSCTATGGNGLTKTATKQIMVKVYYEDNSGANRPELVNNLIPIKYNGSSWVYADTSQEWYNYNNKQWANAVVLKSGVSKSVGQTISESEIDLWYVWIPRYKYQLFNPNNGIINEQEIQINFEKGTTTTGTVKCTATLDNFSENCTNASSGNWYTHPAFTFGEQELTGFWVGKFEVSTTDSTCNSSPSSTNCNKSSHTITIKPNVSSLRYSTVSSFFTAIQNISTIYNINGDSHMMKNIEWGAVAYLSHSKYGTCIDGICVEVGVNNNSNYMTGCGAIAGSSSSSSCNAYNSAIGIKASTTGNIYGIYDMSGGSQEYVMGNMVNSSGTFYSGYAFFNTPLDSMYYDSYEYEGITYSIYRRGKLGDATKETLKNVGGYAGEWYSDYAFFPYFDEPWFTRGGDYNYESYAGVFAFNSLNGGVYANISSRAIMCVY